jgi:hypothetical protein
MGVEGHVVGRLRRKGVVTQPLTIRQVSGELEVFELVVRQRLVDPVENAKRQSRNEAQKRRGGDQAV